MSHVRTPKQKPKEDDFEPGLAALNREIEDVKVGSDGFRAERDVMAKCLTVECKLDELLNRGVQGRLGGIDGRQWWAGITFRRTWRIVAGASRVTASYGSSTCGSDPGVETDRYINACAKLRGAYQALGVVRAAVMDAVAGLDEDVSGRGPVLRDALSLLADHWGIGDAAGYSREMERG